MVLVRVGQQPAALQQPRRCQAGFPASLLESLGLRLVAIGLVQQLVPERRHLGRAIETRKPPRPGVDRLLGAFLLLDAREGELERRFRRGLEAAFAAPVEIRIQHRQAERDVPALGRRRLAPHVFARQVLEAELASAGALPEEVHFQVAGELLRLGEQLRGAGLLEGKQHVRRLDLGALAVRALHVERRRRALEHRAGFQLAIFLIEKVHARTRVCARGAGGSSAGCGRRPAPPPARRRRSARLRAGSPAPRRRSPPGAGSAAA